jgi:Tfp pilus assembly major pilin PilA
VNFINPSDDNKVSCVNCQAVTTNDGRTVWVCEQCGTENPTLAPDVQDAQAAITDAAAAAGTPMDDMATSQMASVPEEPQAPTAPPEPVDPSLTDTPDAVSAANIVQPDI